MDKSKIFFICLIFDFFCFDFLRFGFVRPHFDFVLRLSLSITLSDRVVDIPFDGTASARFIFPSYEKSFPSH